MGDSGGEPVAQPAAGLAEKIGLVVD